MPSFTFTMEFERRDPVNGRDRSWEAEVSYRVIPAAKACLHGDYPHPGEPRSWEIESIKGEYERADDAIADRIDDDLTDHYADYGDWLYEQRRDRAAESYVPAGAA